MKLKFKEDIIMSKANESIACTVQQCEHNDCGSHLCTLQTVKIGTHEANPTVPQCIDCQSFKLKG